MKEKYRILVIGDDEAMQKLYQTQLEKNRDYSLWEAKDGTGALEILNKTVPDIVICQIKMTDMSARELYKRLKYDPHSPYADVYFIIATNIEEKEEALKLINEGIDDYLIKPIDSVELQARLKVAERVIAKIKRSIFERQMMFSHFDVLIIQDGGCSPGYNPVTSFITYHLESQGREVYATRQGFKSLVLGRDDDFVRLVYDPVLFKKLEHIPGVFHAAPLSESRGAQFRSERYREFKDKKIQERAVLMIKEKKVKSIIAIGGDGTFKGLWSMCQLMPTSIQTFFIPVTIDSDIYGTDCIGQHTGIEVGSEKIRSYMADARTHNRIYIIEMMGALGGFHALHSCLGARAHLAVLPSSTIDHKKVMEALNKKEECVIVVAEGYKREERETQGEHMNAAEYFYKELRDTGLRINKKVVCEPFSRDIRGAAPNNQDIMLSQRMAFNVASYLQAGTSRLMPAVLSGREYAIPFNMIKTDNEVPQDLLALSDRLTRQ
ncbi:MAG: 6-phosphofructokinase [Thermodesulfobacteriota bacterium]|nr:6-phosphofructokinase [Thermodesulfobacteriota bacterium]